MNEEVIRALARAAIDRHLAARREHSRVAAAPLETAAVHSSLARFDLPTGGDGSGACLIEPSVRCVQCGYCRLLGH